MTRRTALFFLILSMTACVFARTAAAESLVMNMTRTVTFTPADKTSPPIVTRETVTFYKDFISVRIGNAERIYNFPAKTLVVFDHANKTYMIHPLHAVPIFYERERTQRLAMKIKMNEAVRAAGGDAVDRVSFEDLDLDMAFSTNTNTRTDYLIDTRTENGKTFFFPKKDSFDLAEYTIQGGALAPDLKKAYARYLAHEVAIHPVIEETLKKESNVFASLSYNNRDLLRKTNAHTLLELSSSRTEPDDAPTMPDGYSMRYSTNPQENEIMKRSLTIPPPDMAALDTQIDALIPIEKYAESFMLASEVPLMLTAAETKKYTPGVLNAGFLAAENFDKQIFLAITQSPRSAEDLKKFLDVIESYKGKVGSKDYLLDYFKAQHIRKVLSTKSDPTEEDLALLTQAHDYIITALEQNPRLVNAYFDLGGADFQNNKISDAFVYWDHAARLSPANETLYGIQKLKDDAERKFPEFF